MKLHKFISVLVLLILASCGQAGWNGYYQAYPEKGPDRYIAESAINATILNAKNNKEIWVHMPKGCSGFTFAGIITPFTPPIPIPNFRSLTFKTFQGRETPCHYFIAETRPKTKLLLRATDPETNQLKNFEPREVEGDVGYTRYIFPIRAKDIDSGKLIVEKDGEKIEVPFEYKYYKFWY